MAKPAVDGLEHRNRQRLNVARVDIETESGREIAGRYNITAIPAYVLLDRRGAMVYRQVGGRPDTDAIERLLTSGEHAPR